MLVLLWDADIFKSALASEGIAQSELPPDVVRREANCHRALPGAKRIAAGRCPARSEEKVGTARLADLDTQLVLQVAEDLLDKAVDIIRRERLIRRNKR